MPAGTSWKANRIVSAVNPRAGDHLVEIGPGEGAMTAAFLKSGIPLDAVEIDRDLAAALQNELAPRLTLHLCDVLNFDFHALGKILHQYCIIATFRNSFCQYRNTTNRCL